MRKKIVAGNWKMNMNYKEAGLLFDQMQSARFPDDVTVIIAPPAVYLSEFAMKQATSGLKLSAQNCHFMPNGAFTGEVSAAMLSSLAIEYCLVGHSERRQMFGETDESVGKKVKALIDHGITPIVCVGEMLDQRYAETHFDVVEGQVKAALSLLEKGQVEKVVIAYEPVWAIGTGQTATTAQAGEMHEHIFKLLLQQFGEPCANEVAILYGGSCNATNAAELFSQPYVDGGLIGGASLKEADFLRIIHAF